VSHASEDAITAEALVAALEATGTRCWISSRDIPVGASYAQEIVTGVKASCGMVVFLLARPAQN